MSNEILLYSNKYSLVDYNKIVTIISNTNIISTMVYVLEWLIVVLLYHEKQTLL